MFYCRGVPPEETGSANSVYQVLRYVGYSVGSALSAVLLVVNTSAGTNQPTGNGYTAAAWTGIVVLVLAAAALFLSRKTNKPETMEAVLFAATPTVGP